MLDIQSNAFDFIYIKIKTFYIYKRKMSCLIEYLEKINATTSNIEIIASNINEMTINMNKQITGMNEQMTDMNEQILI
jgi:hypothetical protein